MVLNNRLNKFLEENQIIEKVQIGFTKNTRTSDHMFILKSLFDKYTNMEGGKLYACFVDFQKAFDYVIHPGLQVKLKEININGKFYEIVSSLYSKSKLCVRLGEIGQISLILWLEFAKEMYLVRIYLRFL